jgi:hypothetical protein
MNSCGLSFEKPQDNPIQILPNGEIREVGQTNAADLGTKTPLTMKENLGGEY